MSTYSPIADAVTPFSILRITAGKPATDTELDHIAIEEPLAITLGYTRGDIDIRKTVSITMRTPGHDHELAIGFLFTEGIVHDREDIVAITASSEHSHAVTVTLRPGLAVDLRTLERNNDYTTSSCGVCGKASLDAVRTTTRYPLPDAEPSLEPSVIHRLPETLRAAQAGFEQTGGLHAAALFTHDGQLLALREDIGRHNAVDKLIGAQLLAGHSLPLSDCIVFVSSRASFELVQKILMAGCPILAAVGAPSSLALELAREAGATLLGFVRDQRFNVYSGASRLRALTRVSTCV
jgi:FdhD protein